MLRPFRKCCDTAEFVLSESDITRFWAFVPDRQAYACWLWAGPLVQRSGYGMFKVASDNRKAHRVSWVIHNGSIPENAYVLHHCDVKRCVNPSHLYLGDHWQNVKDRVDREQQVYGSRLSDDDVRQIRLLRARGADASRIAVRFGVARSYVYGIACGRKRKSVTV